MPQQSGPYFEPTEYERPNQPWVCGWAAEGHACRLGPDAAGLCRASYECVPRSEGDRWQCTRSRLAGGRCANGPLPDGTCSHPIPPCQPVRSLRAKRGVLSRYVTALTLGGMLIAVAPRWRESLLSPGELSFAHSSVEAGCAACHSAIDADPVHWLSRGLLLGTTNHDSHLCTDCHPLGADAYHAHSMQPEELRRLTASASPAASDEPAPFALGLAKLGPGLPTGPEGELACATCHKEHHGKLFDLKHMGQARCQVCHAVQFGDFRTGHPEFADYPFRRRTRLYFDHASHFGRHFHELSPATSGGEARPACLDCHVVDLAGRSVRLRGFEQTCARCHEPQIEEDLLPGLAYLRLPALDLETLVDKEIPVGQWPTWMLGGSTPYLDVLLADDPGYRDVRAALRQLNLSDLHSADRDQLEAVAEYVWAIKRLLLRLSTEGPGDRVEQEDDVSRVGIFASQVPPELLRVAAKDWFPDLTAEVQLHEAGAAVDCRPLETQASGAATVVVRLIESFVKVLETLRVVSGATTNGPRPADEQHAGWYLDPFAETGHYEAIRYRPTGHADEFLRQCLEIPARQYADSNVPEMKAIFDSLANPLMPGRCAKCHTVDRQEDGHREVRWSAAAPVAGSHRFTEFAHQPHLTLLGESECTECHRIESDEELRKAFIRGGDSLVLSPETSHHNFIALTKNDCSRCHRVAGAGDSCLICHNYHIGHMAGRKLGR